MQCRGPDIRWPVASVCLAPSRLDPSSLEEQVTSEDQDQLTDTAA